jgi:hypothetical protein
VLRSNKCGSALDTPEESCLRRDEDVYARTAFDFSLASVTEARDIRPPFPSAGLWLLPLVHLYLLVLSGPSLASWQELPIYTYLLCVCPGLLRDMTDADHLRALGFAQHHSVLTRVHTPYHPCLDSAHRFPAYFSGLRGPVDSFFNNKPSYSRCRCWLFSSSCYGVKLAEAWV